MYTHINTNRGIYVYTYINILACMWTKKSSPILCHHPSLSPIALQQVLLITCKPHTQLIYVLHGQPTFARPTEALH